MGKHERFFSSGLHAHLSAARMCRCRLVSTRRDGLQLTKQSVSQRLTQPFSSKRRSVARGLGPDTPFHSYRTRK
jgi:hypothetical protein